MAICMNLFTSTLMYYCLLLSLSSHEAYNHQKKQGLAAHPLFQFQGNSAGGNMTPPHPIHRESRKGSVRFSVPALHFKRQADPEMLEQSRAAQRLEWTLLDLRDQIKQRRARDTSASGFPTLTDVELIVNLSGCHRPFPFLCTMAAYSGKYRTISGICNNRDRPFWGAANIALARWLPPEYEDGEWSPRGWQNGHLYHDFPLPPVREVSNVIMRDSGGHLLEDEAYSQMLVDWGQYLDHDISFTPQSASQDINPAQPDCSQACENTKLCFPIQVPPGDQLSGQRECLPFTRSAPACPSDASDINALFHKLHTGLQREQPNGITSFLDASTVYGSSSSLELRLRDLSSPFGGLAINAHLTDHGQAHLPFVSEPSPACLPDLESSSDKKGVCLLAGDSRVNEVISLSALHTLWVREHNRVSYALKSLNPHWSMETTYQETRKIIGALHQIITFRDYIPKVLGPEAFTHYIGVYKGYNSSVNPTVSNIFATAAFRFGHATVSPMLWRLNESFQEHDLYPSLSLHQSFFRPWRLLREGGLDPVLRGMLGKPTITLTPNHLMTSELTQRLLVLTSPGSLDLTALNLQRGRDHGLAGYNDWRTFCGLKRVETVTELKSVMNDPDLVKRLMNLYGHPNNIDVWLGGLLEDHVPGGRTGPLFACLIGKQMKVLRDGDRFWWENNEVFTQAQRRELQKHSLSRVICDNSGVREVPPDPFRKAHYPHDFMSCNNIRAMNLEAWLDVVSKACCDYKDP